MIEAILSTVLFIVNNALVFAAIVYAVRKYGVPMLEQMHRAFFEYRDFLKNRIQELVGSRKKLEETIHTQNGQFRRLERSVVVWRRVVEHQQKEEYAFLETCAHSLAHTQELQAAARLCNSMCRGSVDDACDVAERMLHQQFASAEQRRAYLQRALGELCEAEIRKASVHAR